MCCPAADQDPGGISIPKNPNSGLQQKHEKVLLYRAENKNRRILWHSTN